MIDLSASSRHVMFRALFVHGALFHCQGFRFSENDMRDKYLLVMRGQSKEGKSYFYLPTSQVEKLRSNPIFHNEYYLFESGSIQQFKKETAINIRNLKEGLFQDFADRYVFRPPGRCLDFVASIENDHMAAICKLVHESPSLSLHYKQLALPIDL